MKPVNKSVFWIIFTIVFIDLLGFGIVFPLLPLYARSYHLNEFQVGLILGIYSLMQFLFAPILGRLSDKIGRRPVLIVSLLGTSLSFFMLAWSKSFIWFLVARAVDGIAGSNLATAQAYIADISPKEQRTRNLGMWIGAAFGLGFAFGPFIGGALNLLGQAIVPSFALGFPFFAAGLLALANTLAAFFILPESLTFRDSQHLVGRRTFSLGVIQDRLSDTVGSLIVTYAIVVFAFAQMEATYTWLSHDLFKLSSIGIYAMFGYLGFVMALVQGGLVRRLEPKLGDKNLTTLGCSIMVVSLAAMPLIHTLAWLLLTSGALALGEGLCNPALISSISKGAHESLQGETMGVSQSLASLSRFFGPLLAGYLYMHYGAESPYFISAIIMLFALTIGLSGYKKLLTQASSKEQPVSA